MLTGPSGEIEEIHASVRDTLRRLSVTGELPSLPHVVSEGLARLRVSDGDLESICDVIQRDVGLAARTLRLANSVVFGRRRACRRLIEALTTVGAQRMEELLLAASLRSLYPASNPVAQGLWEHAFTAGLAAEEVAKTVGGFARGTVFLPALFHDVGRILFFLSDPIAFEVLSGPLDASDGGRRSREQELFGFDHATAGGVLAREWGLPQDAWEAIHYHHAPGDAPPWSSRLTEVLVAADRIAYRVWPSPETSAPPEAPSLELSPDDEACCVTQVAEALGSQGDLLL